MSQKRIGILITYANLVAGMIINVFLTPYMIASLGDVDYSIYKVIQSFAGPLAMFQLGVSTVVARSIAKEQNATEIKRNTLAHALLASVIMAMMVLLAASVMYVLIPTAYGKTYGAESILAARKMFVFFATASILHILTDAFSGCVIGHEHFAINSSIAFGKTLGKVLLYLVFLKCGLSVVSLAVADMILAAGVFALTAGYALLVLKERPKVIAFDKKMMIEILSFGVAIFLQTFVNQVNNNVDIMILGGCTEDKSYITMYASALAIYTIYNSLISVMTNFYLPDATKLLNKGASGDDITDFVIHRGRWQAIIAVACVFGFILFGRNFIRIWIGENYINAYYVILMLMIPVTVPLVENSMIAVLDAMLKRFVRSVTLVVMAILNVAISLWLVRTIGFWGAALGTVISLIVGHGVVMNIYYSRAFGVNVLRMFREIFRGILPSGILASVLCIPVAVYLSDTITSFVIKCLCFVGVYCLFLNWFGLNDAEKRTLFSRFGILTEKS